MHHEQLSRSGWRKVFSRNLSELRAITTMKVHHNHRNLIPSEVCVHSSSRLAILHPIAIREIRRFVLIEETLDLASLFQFTIPITRGLISLSLLAYLVSMLFRCKVVLVRSVCLARQCKVISPDQVDIDLYLSLQSKMIEICLALDCKRSIPKQ